MLKKTMLFYCIIIASLFLISAEVSQLNLTNFEIVDINNAERGFLPEIFRGIGAFFSCNIVSIFVLTFIFFLVLSLVAIFGIIINMFKKIA